MTFGSLFTGIGGIDLGLERAGWKCGWQVEIDPFCTKVLERHWPGVPRYGDITKLTGDELERVDLIAGGFPCQDLSQAGKQMGIEGSHSSLWFDFARIVGMVGPRFVVVENVPGLLVPDGMPRVVGELARLGYVGIWFCLRASDFGASHIRKRVFIVAYREHPGRIVSGEAYDGNRNHASGNNANGCNPDVANTRLPGNRRSAESEGLHKRGTSDHDSGTSGTLADAGNGRPPIPQRRPQGRNGTGSPGEVLPDAGGTRLPDTEPAQLSGPQRQTERRTITELCGAFAPGPADCRWPAILAARPDLAPTLESAVRGMVDGISNRLDGAMRDRTKRLGRLGNAVVPEVAEWIGRRILEIEAMR